MVLRPWQYKEKLSEPEIDHWDSHFLENLNESDAEDDKNAEQPRTWQHIKISDRTWELDEEGDEDELLLTKLAIKVVKPIVTEHFGGEDRLFQLRDRASRGWRDDLHPITFGELFP